MSQQYEPAAVAPKQEIDEYLNDDNLSHSHEGMTSKGSLERRNSSRDNVDILYLYSVPYINKDGSGISSMGIPIDHTKEINDIINKGLDLTKKMINFRIQNATVDSLRELSIIQPKVALLSCHGDKYNTKNQYYLFLESCENLGQAEHVTEQRLKELFKNQKGKIPVE